MRVLIPLPAFDFDPTEAGVTWKILTQNKIPVTFATPENRPALGDVRMITGEGLGIWSKILRTDENGLQAYNEMIKSQEFQNPISWTEAKEAHYAGIVLPGGHAPGMKDYLESRVLQNLIVNFFTAKKIVGAICHGVVLVARSKQTNGDSILKGYKVTALLRSQELTAWALTCLWLNNYYRTYKETVQSEVTRNLASSEDFCSGPLTLRRDSPQSKGHGFIIEDRNLISARWPGDAHCFGERLAYRFANE